MKRLSILLFMLIAFITARGQTTGWNSNVTWTPQFRQVSGAYEMRFALGGSRPYFNLSDSLNNIRNNFINYYNKTQTDLFLAAKQATLVSGTNIKTINGNSLLGSGNIIISGGGSYSFTNGIQSTGNPNEYGLGGDGVWNYDNNVRIGGIGKGTLSLNNFGSYSTASIGGFLIGGGGASFQAQGNGLVMQIQPTSADSKLRGIEILTNRFTIRDSINNEGMKYAQKYRTNLTNRSIVDKEAIDSLIAAAITAALSGYTPASQIDNNLSSSSTRGASRDAINGGLDLKANLAGSNTYTAGNADYKGGGVRVFNSAGTNALVNLNKILGSGFEAGALILGNRGTVNGSVTIQPDETNNGTFTQKLQGKNGTVALLSDISSSTPDTTIYRTVANSRSLAQTQTALNLKENTANKQNSLTVDGTGAKFPTVDAVNAGLATKGNGTVTNVSVVSANGISGSVATATTTPAITLTLGNITPTSIATTVKPATIYQTNTSSNPTTDSLVVKDAATGKLATIPGTWVASSDFSGQGTTGSPFTLNIVSSSKGGAGNNNGILKANGSGVVSTATAGTDYLTPTGSAAGLTSFPTLNQNTTGSAASLTTSRNFWGLGFNGTANVTGKPFFTASATGAASINIPHGVAPSSPVNGDIWTTTAGEFQRINGVTKQVAYTTDIPATPTLQQVTTAGSTTTTGANFGGNVNASQIGGGTFFIGNTGSYTGRWVDGGTYLSLDTYNGTSMGKELRLQGSSVTILPTSNVLIGTTTDNGVDKLQVNGSISATNLISGTYTPTATVTDVSGTVTSVTPQVSHYSRVGNQVTVYGVLTFVTAASNTNVTVETTLPIASNFANGYDLNGTGDVRINFTNYSANTGIAANTTTKKAAFTLNTATGTFSLYYSYMYTIL